MDSILFYLLFTSILILFIGGIAYIGYWIFKKLGYKKTGIITAIVIATSFVVLILSFVFEDELFTKSDAEKLLLQQNIKLQDDFKILSNKSSGWNDFVHIFEIQISNEDKTIIMNKIKSANDFKPEITDEIYLPALETDRYKGDTLRGNYQSPDYFISSIYYTNGANIKPTYRSVKVSKNQNILRFEEILD